MECLYFPVFPKPEENNSDWVYTKRREMQEILPGLFLGPYASATKSKLDELQKHNITHIVCIRQSNEANFIRPNFPQLFRYLIIDIADIVTENIIRHFPRVKEFIDGCFKGGGSVLVHGNGGISRSAALVIAYVMEKYGQTYQNAFQFVQQKRLCICPNEGFVQQLSEYEPIYKARLTLERGQPSQENGLLKRKFVEDESDDVDIDMDNS